MRGAIILVMLAGASFAGCAAAGQGGGSSGSADVITREEILEANVTTALEAIEALRPEMIRARGVSSGTRGVPDLPVIYVDGMRFGGMRELQTIRANDVFEIRYLDASDATMRYGTDHAGGAILVRTRTGRD